MTEFQLSTFHKVQSIEQQLTEAIDPTTFMLNPRVVQLTMELDDVRSKCQHQWVDGVCAICGAEESK